MNSLLFLQTAHYAKLFLAQLHLNFKQKSARDLMGNCCAAQNPEPENISAPRPIINPPVVSPRFPQSGGNLHAFSFGDLKAATRRFGTLLAEGEFVYKGHIDEHTFMPTRPGEGRVIAVKKLEVAGVQGHKEWLKEVQYLGELHHKNLLKLLGFCAEDNHRLLVYEFMCRGSLEKLLFRHGHTLSWAVRMRIAVDAAKGLAFLHHAQRPVIYRDFRTSTILLDSHYNAKLSYFGLAKDGPTGGNTHVTTRVVGNLAYAAPEYVATGHLSAKSDVYSFGVVFLEILSGRQAVDKNQSSGEQKLVEWARKIFTEDGKGDRIIDHRLQGKYALKGALTAANVALHCLHPEARSRPTMQEVVESLEPLCQS